MVNPHVGNNVKKDDLPATDVLSQVVQSGSNDQETDVRDGDQRSLRAGEEGANGVEMAVSEHLRTLLLGRQTLVSSADVEQHVKLPAEHLVAEQSDSVVERSFLNQLNKLAEHRRLPGLHLRLSGGHKDNILVDVSVVTVMSAVGDLP